MSEEEDDRRLEEALADALMPEPGRTPPPERVAALRARVEARASAARPASGSPEARPPAPVGTAASGDRSTGFEPGQPAEVVELTPRRHDSRRRDVLVGGIAASIGAVLGVGGVLATRDDQTPNSPKGPPTEPVTFASAPSGVTTDAALINHTWGVELMLNVKGLPGGRMYQVVYEGTGGAPVVAGSFLSVADTLMKCRFNAALLRADTKAINVVGPDGNQVLRVTLA